MKSRLAIAAVLFAAFAGCSKPSEGASGAPAGSAAPAANGRVIEVEATNEGYKPSSIEAKTGEDLVLRFTRKTKSECLAQIVFPEQKIKKDLPLDKPVDVAIKAEKAGKIPFECGMAMVKGTINVTGS